MPCEAVRTASATIVNRASSVPDAIRAEMSGSTAYSKESSSKGSKSGCPRTYSTLCPFSSLAACRTSGTLSRQKASKPASQNNSGGTSEEPPIWSSLRPRLLQGEIRSCSKSRRLTSGAGFRSSSFLLMLIRLKPAFQSPDDASSLIRAGNGKLGLLTILAPTFLVTAYGVLVRAVSICFRYPFLIAEKHRSPGAFGSCCSICARKAAASV